MAPQHIESESVQYLKTLFKTRAGRNARVIRFLFINCKFCYIEKQGNDVVIFRLRDNNAYVITLKLKITETTAFIFDIWVQSPLDRIEFLYPLLLEVLIYTVNMQNQLVLFEPIGEPREVNFINVLKQIGFGLETYSLTLDLQKKHIPFVSDLLKAHDAVSSYNRLTENNATLLTFGRTEHILFWIFITDSGHGDFAFIYKMRQRLYFTYIFNLGLRKSW